MRAIPGVEVVELGTYRRSISLHGCNGHFAVSRDEGTDALSVRIQFDDPRSQFFIIERIRATFGLSAHWTDSARPLRQEPAMVLQVCAAPGLRQPGCWH